MMGLRVGFKVNEWQNKPFKDFTNEEILEYWHRLRLSLTPGEISDNNPSGTQLYIVDLQQEILRRMTN